MISLIKTCVKHRNCHTLAGESEGVEFVDAKHFGLRESLAVVIDALDRCGRLFLVFEFGTHNGRKRCGLLLDLKPLITSINETQIVQFGEFCGVVGLDDSAVEPFGDALHLESQRLQRIDVCPIDRQVVVVEVDLELGAAVESLLCEKLLGTVE